MTSWLNWIEHLGHDVYAYPSWISQQQRACKCTTSYDANLAFSSNPSRPSFTCLDTGKQVDWRAAARSSPAAALTYCVSKAWLLEHMPTFDLHFLPGSVAVNSTSMLDDVIAFALMADHAAPWSARIPLAIRLAYILPYGSYHESRQNWRPLFFAKFFGLVANATSVEDAWGRLLAPNAFVEWSQHYWPASSQQAGSGNAYTIKWSSSTAPPVVAPLDFLAYGYGSCSAWATLVTYVGRAVGLPARQAGTPCWNSIYEGDDFRGRASGNPNVSLCWHGGSSARGHGGGFLNNHNWAEVYIPPVAQSAAQAAQSAAQAAQAAASSGSWKFVNVPPQSKTPGTGLCGAEEYDSEKGCGFDAQAKRGHECDGVTGGPGAAMQDHEILAVTWSLPQDDPEAFAVAGRLLTDGKTALTPLVWSPALASPLGQPLRDVGLRVINRTRFYRCKPSV